LYKEYRTIKDKGVIAVVTQPPKPAGRDKKIEYSAVDTWAYKKDIRILRDLDMRSSDTGKNLPEADLGVVAAYGKIIPKEIISHFKFGILNIHPSLLPKYRGASPTQAAIAAGETTTGVTVIKMDENMDHGPVVSSLKE
jgi:methionyl-tRNA formyltransferase